MDLPLILEDHGDLCLFESAEALERYVEAADIDEYRVYDATGTLFRLAASPPRASFGRVESPRSPVRIVREGAVDNRAPELVELLRGFLARVAALDVLDLELPALLVEMRRRVGVTL